MAGQIYFSLDSQFLIHSMHILIFSKSNIKL